MSQTDVPETDDRDGRPRMMPQTDVPKTQGQDGGKVFVSACVGGLGWGGGVGGVSVCLCVCVSVCLCVCLCVSLSVFYSDVVYIMYFVLNQSVNLLSCNLFTFC